MKISDGIKVFSFSTGVPNLG